MDKRRLQSKFTFNGRASRLDYAEDEQLSLFA